MISAPIIISSDSRRAATGSEDGTIIVWDLQSGCISQEWFAEDAGVDSLAFSPDSRHIVSASKRAAVTVWDLHQGPRRVNSLMEGGGRASERIHCTWSPDGSWMAAGPLHDGATNVWDTTTFQRLDPHPTASKDRLLAISADGRWAVTVDDRLPDITAAGDLHPRVHDCWIWSRVDPESGMRHRSLQGHIDSVLAAAFNPESTRVVTGSDDSTVRIWDVGSGEQLFVLEEQPKKSIRSVAFSGDGRLVLSCSVLKALGIRRMGKEFEEFILSGAKVWDASNGALLRTLSTTRADGSNTPHATCFSPCGTYVVSASGDSAALILWRISDWSYIARVSGGGARVTRVAISPDGRVLCWGTEAGTVFFRRMHDLISPDEDCLG